MASTADRLRKLVTDNIEVDGKALDLPDDLDFSLADAGVPSTDIVTLAKMIAEDFNVTITPDDCAAIDNLKKVVDFIDGQAA